jgi:Domain of unknown function (DUF4365)
MAQGTMATRVFNQVCGEKDNFCCEKLSPLRPKGEGAREPRVGASMNGALITTIDNDIKERLCIAYVTAVAARAGCQIVETPVDRNKVDVTISAIQGTPVKIDVQCKATSADILRDDHVAFALEVETYDKLRSTLILAPQLLVVLVLPPDRSDWLNANEDSLVARQCAYWLNLAGEPPTANLSTITVHLPRAQVFNPLALTTLMNAAHTRLEQGLTA